MTAQRSIGIGLGKDLRYMIMLFLRFALRIREKTAIQCVKIN